MIFELDPPPPKPPFRCPHQDKKGTNLLHFQTGVHLHTHQDLELKCCSCRVMGQKLRYGRPCTHNLPTTGLHSPTLLPFPHISTDYFMLAQSWKIRVTCCSISLTHPAACTQARVPPTIGRVHRPPLNPNCPKRVPIDWA